MIAYLHLGCFFSRKHPKIRVSFPQPTNQPTSSNLPQPPVPVVSDQALEILRNAAEEKKMKRLGMEGKHPLQKRQFFFAPKRKLIKKPTPVVFFFFAVQTVSFREGMDWVMKWWSSCFRRAVRGVRMTRDLFWGEGKKQHCTVKGCIFCAIFNRCRIVSIYVSCGQRQPVN